MFVALQNPQFQEDEGRYFTMGAFPAKPKALEFVENYVKLSKGYFTESCFTIMEESK